MGRRWIAKWVLTRLLTKDNWESVLRGNSITPKTAFRGNSMEENKNKE